MTRNNYSPLKWSNNIEDQHHRKWHTYNQMFPLVTTDRLLPTFQVIRDQRANSITQFDLYSFDAKTTTSLLSQVVTNNDLGLHVHSYTNPNIDYDLIIYPAATLLTNALSEGMYYLIMSDGVETWYSEVFGVSSFIDDLLKIEYWHDEAFVVPDGHIRYDHPFKNTVFISATIGKPEYQFEDRVRKRDGYNFPIYQASWKMFKFEFLAAEYLIDALRLIRQHHFVRIHSQGSVYNVDEFILTTEWTEFGDVAKAEVEFTTDTVVTTTGKGKIPSGGDYDQTDYNEDYLTGN